MSDEKKETVDNIEKTDNETIWTDENEKELQALKKWKQLKDLRELKKKEEEKQERAKKLEEEKKIRELFIDGDEVDGELPDEMEDYLMIREETQDYRNIIISNFLKASFIKTIRGTDSSGLDLIFYYGDYVSPAYHFTKAEINERKWKDILKNKIYNNEEREYTDFEIYAISEIARRALENAKIKDVSQIPSFKTIFRDLYYKAYDTKVKRGKKKPEVDISWNNWLHISNIDDSIKTITLLNYRDYGECICICDKKMVLDELLKVLEIEWSSLEFKNQLKSHDFLVISKNDNYASIIQVKKLEEFKDVKLRKFLIIPVNREPVKSWIDEVKEEIGIKGEAKPKKKAKQKGVVKPEGETKPEGEVKTEAETKPEGEVKTEAETKPEGEVKPEVEAKEDIKSEMGEETKDE